MRRTPKAAILAAGILLVAAVRSVPGAGKPATPAPSAKSAKSSPAAPPRMAESGDVAVLSNGLRVLFLESRSNPMVASTVAVLSGVRDETPATNGASHFLEHMLFDGTTSRTQEQIQRDVEFIGGYNNATTRDELTLFLMLVHRDKLAPALDIQSDMLFRSTIPADAFERERKVVLEELARDSSSPGYGPEQFFKSRYYAGTPRALPVLGSAASVGKVTRDAVFEHYRKHYRPERMVLFLAGDFDRAAVLPLLEKTFGVGRGAGAGSGPAAAGSGPATAGISAPATRAPAPAGPPPPVRGAMRPGFYREPIDGERGYLKIGIPAPGIGDPDAASFAAIASLLGGGAGSRLASALLGTRDTGTIDAGADYVAGAGEGRLEIQATLQPGSNGYAAIGAIRRELQRFAVEPVPAEELRAFVTSAGSESVYLRDQVHYLGMSVGSDLILGPRPTLGVGQAELGALTPQSLQQVAARWLEATGAGGGPATPRDPRTGTAPASAASRAPSSGAAAPVKRAPDAGRPSMVVTLSSPSVPSIADREGADPIPAAAPLAAASSDSIAAAAPGAPSTAPGGTDGATGRSAASGPMARTSVRREVLDNGLTVLIGENADSQVFAAHVLVRDRAAMEPADRTGIADVLHRLLPHGSLYLDGEGLSLKLKTLGAHLKTVDDPGIPFDDYYNSPRYSYVRFETTHENWREGLGYLFTTLAYPRLDDTDVALATAEEMDIARKRAETPSAVARDLYTKTILKDGPLAHPVTGTPVSLAAIKPDDLRAFRDRYFSPERIVLSVVSDVPASDVLAVVNATFGRMKRGKAGAGDPGAAGPAAGAAAPPLTDVEKRAETQTGRPQSQILMGRVFERKDEDFAALVVATTILSQAIGRELRDARGLAYAAGCSLEDYGDRSWFTASVGTKPENVAEAENAIRETIRAFPGRDLDESVVERAVNSMRGTGAMRRMTRISQAYSLGFNELLGRPVDFDATLDARLADVKAADVKRVVGAYLEPDRLVTAIAK